MISLHLPQVNNIYFFLPKKKIIFTFNFSKYLLDFYISAYEPIHNKLKSELCESPKTHVPLVSGWTGSMFTLSDFNLTTFMSPLPYLLQDRLHDF
jgi:hypothetical protein